MHLQKHLMVLLALYYGRFLARFWGHIFLEVPLLDCISPFSVISLL